MYSLQGEKKENFGRFDKKKKVFKNQTTQVKEQNRIVYLMKKNIEKKHLHHLKIGNTTLVVLMRRHVNPIIIQVKLMVVQETWAKNIKMNKMKNSLKIHLK